jgi:DNA invertase Pin-like site-specific DNA recombinase
MSGVATPRRSQGNRRRPDFQSGLQVIAALIYRRVSKDEMARDSVSLDTQLTLCRRYIAGKPLWEVGGEYQDMMTGTRDDRPDYQRVLADVRRL